MMSFYAISALINAVASTIVGIFVYLHDRKRVVNRTFTLFSASVALWSYSYFLWQISKDVQGALFWVRMLILGTILIPPTFFHFISAFVQQFESKKKSIITTYVIFGAFALFTFSPLMVRGVTQKLIFKFWPEPGVVFNILLGAWIIYVIYTLSVLFAAFIKSAGIQRLQIKYVFLGMFFGFLGGMTNYFLWYNIPILPIGNSLVVLFVIAVGYAAIKHRLFDIKVIVTEMLIFMIWIFLAARVLLGDSWQNRMEDGGLLVLMIIFGILLIRSVLKEVQQRERLEKLTEDLERVNEELKRTEKLKAEFFSFAAHQVKSPMAVIKGYARLIFDGAFTNTDKVKEVGKKINTAASRTLTMVNNLLDMRKIEEGRMVYILQQADVVAPIRTIVNDLETLAKDKGLLLTFESSQDEIVLNMDTQKFMQVIQNLIDNAVKYTDAGWIKVRVEVIDEKVLFTVSDSGRGISKEFASKMFEQFSRDPALSKDTKGTGLGLFIAKQIVEAHGGRIWAASEGEGSGSTFSVEIPLDNAAAVVAAVGN